MKALSLWQPWASLIAHGLKEYETRSWATSYRGLLAIHASKRWTEAEKRALDNLCYGFPAIAQTFLDTTPPLGAVVCICKLVAIYPTVPAMRNGVSDQERAVGDWSPGRFVWKLEVEKVFDTPIPAVGRQGLWEWSV